MSRKGHTLSVVNQVDLEEYVKGVVPSEVSSAWHPEMLKVQAVAARTYALYNKMLSAAREYDVMSTIQDQVYRGRSGVDHRVEEAVESTRGIVVTHLQAPIYAAFSSTAAGPTEDAVNVWANKDLPYLKGVECPFDIESPYYQWKASVKIDHLEQNLRRQGFSVGTIATITPIVYSRAGRVARLRILHSAARRCCEGRTFVRRWDIQSFRVLNLKSNRSAPTWCLPAMARAMPWASVNGAQRNWRNSAIHMTVFCSTTIQGRSYTTRPCRS